LRHNVFGSSFATPAVATDSEIREGLSGNFCRCTGYLGIVAAAHRAAELAAESAPQR
jgi:carbon-monoxide dehydrogenase small subunit